MKTQAQAVRGIGLVAQQCAMPLELQGAATKPRLTRKRAKNRVQQNFFIGGRQQGDDIRLKIEYLAKAQSRRAYLRSGGGPSLGRMVQRRGFNAAATLKIQNRGQTKIAMAGADQGSD
jgi:hypothetical protein